MKREEEREGRGSRLTGEMTHMNLLTLAASIPNALAVVHVAALWRRRPGHVRLPQCS